MRSRTASPKCSGKGCVRVSDATPALRRRMELGQSDHWLPAPASRLRRIDAAQLVCSMGGVKR